MTTPSSQQLNKPESQDSKLEQFVDNIVAAAEKLVTKLPDGEDQIDPLDNTLVADASMLDTAYPDQKKQGNLAYREQAQDSQGSHLAYTVDQDYLKDQGWEQIELPRTENNTTGVSLMATGAFSGMASTFS